MSELNPKPPAFYVTMDPEWADLNYGFPYPPNDQELHTASDGSKWVFNSLGNGEWDMTNYPPTGDPYMAVKQRQRAFRSN